MSKLNAGAFEFVPGNAFRIPPPQQQPTPPPLQPVERPEQTEAPAPAPTISLNIGGPKPQPVPSPAPSAPPPAPAPATSAKAAPKPATSASSGGSGASTPVKASAVSSPAPAAPASRTFTLAKAKNDTAAIAQEVQNAADEAVLQELFGDRKSSFPCSPFSLSHSSPLFEVKEHLSIVFVGHVDAGKSTMGGNILFLSGSVDKRTMEKYEKEAKDAGRETWYLSFALDSTPQERLQGKTVEVGRAYFETATRRYTILDAPGHKTYVPSMITGAAQADVAILVISARKGEFETGFERGGQTREHIMLVKTAGVGKLIVVINKMDDPTVGWAKARFDEIKEKLTPFVRGAGFNPKTDVTWLPVSAYTGANLKDRVASSVCAWWECVTKLAACPFPMLCSRSRPHLSL